MQTFHLGRDQHGFLLHLRDESTLKNHIADVADRVCGLTGHVLERWVPTYRVVSWFLMLPERDAKRFGTIRIDRNAARALSEDSSWVDEAFEDNEDFGKDVSAAALKHYLVRPSTGSVTPGDTIPVPL